MTTIKEALEGQFVGKSEFLELQKAITTAAGSAGDIIEPEIDARLQNLVVKKYPFYTWMQSQGLIDDTRSNKPSYLQKVTGGAGGFIAEAATLTSVTDSVYDLKTGDMTTFNMGIEISDQMLKGSADSVVDILQQEIQDAMEYQIQAVNAGMLTGTGSSYTITGLQSLITTNTTNMSGAEITDKFTLDSLCQTMMDAGGLPSALVTSANVKSQLETILYPNININLTPKINVGFVEGGVTFGYQATQYDSPAGPIPIIVDPAMPTTTDQQRAFFVDASTLMLKYLMRPTILDLAKTKLTESSVLASFQSFMCRAEAFNAQIYNIGTKTA